MSKMHAHHSLKEKRARARLYPVSGFRSSVLFGNLSYLVNPSLIRDRRVGSVCARLVEFPWDNLAAEEGLSGLSDILVFV